VKTKAANDRVDIIQAVLDSRRTRHYLEIGVQSGDTFFRLKARKKMAVDPQFLFTTFDKLRWLRWNPYNLFNEYYQIGSDDFFSENSSMLAARRLDVVFVDGLHTYEQSLRDIENSLRYLRDGGAIIVDDCDPPNEPASRPIKPKNNAPWCGDVWKSIVHLRSIRADLQAFVLDCAFGLGIVVKQPAQTMLSYSVSDIKDMSYGEFSLNRQSLLDLKPQHHIAAFLDERRKLAI
jgi:SAM-dependent methyltransferase